MPPASAHPILRSPCCTLSSGPRPAQCSVFCWFAADVPTPAKTLLSVLQMLFGLTVRISIDTSLCCSFWLTQLQL
jgi:hypothetical protein